MNKSSEKRHNPRLECQVPVDEKRGKSLAITQTMDISKHGLGFLSRKSILPNERIAVELQLTEDEEPIVVSGTVRWVKKLMSSKLFRVGIKFEEVLSGSQSRLNKFFKV